MPSRTASHVALLIGLFALAETARAANVTIVAGLRHNGTTKIDITDPNNDQVINTSEWGTGPTIANSAHPAGTFNGPLNDGEKWSKVFDSSLGTAGPWGTGSSKVCCSFDPLDTSLTMTSSVTPYSLSGYTVSNSNDTPTRDPTGWRLFGSNDNFATAGVLLDTVTLANINGGAGWGAGRNQTGEVTLASPTAGFSSFRFIFDSSADLTPGSTSDEFALAEIELLGTAVPEPATIGLFAAGAVALLVRRRRA